MEYLVGIDIGTQGTKGCLVDLKGTYVATAFQPSRLIYGANGAVEQSPQEILDSVLKVLRTLAQTPDILPADIKAIAIDGQMAGIMGIDAAFEAVTPYDSWLDTRCEPYIESMKQRARKEIVLTTGCPVTYAHGPKILWWKQERPQVFCSIKKFVTLTCFVTGRLAGLTAKDAYIDYTQLHFSGFGDVKNLTWSDRLLNMFDIPKEKMPRIVPPWERVGILTSSMADACGLAEGTVLVAGCGDQAATSLGAGIVTPGQAFDVAGTASVFSCCVEQYRPDVEEETIIFARSVLPELWVPLAYINGGGMCLKWFAQEILRAGHLNYAQWDAESAALARGSEELLFLPHFSGRVCPNMPKMKGSWLGLSWNHTAAHLFRAVMESIGYEYALYLERIRALQQFDKTWTPYDQRLCCMQFDDGCQGMTNKSQAAITSQAACTTVTAIGGGAKSSVFNRIKADVLGVEYQTLAQSDTAPLGCALLAGYALGRYPDLAQAAREFATKRDVFCKDVAAQEIYRPFVARYRSALNMTAAFYRENY